MKNLKSKSKEKRCTLKKKTDQRPFYILKSPEIETSRTVAALPAAGRPRSYVHQLVKPDPVLYLLSVCPVL